MIVTYDPPRPPAPIKTAADLFRHVPKALAEAETERGRLEEKLERISEKERVGSALAVEFKKLCERRDKLAAAIAYATDQAVGMRSFYESASEGILQRIGNPSSPEGLIIGQAREMEAIRAAAGHCERFIEIRRAELTALETEIQTFAKANGIEYPSK